MCVWNSFCWVLVDLSGEAYVLKQYTLESEGNLTTQRWVPPDESSQCWWTQVSHHFSVLHFIKNTKTFLVPEGFMVTHHYRNLVFWLFQVMMKFTFVTGPSCLVQMVLVGLRAAKLWRNLRFYEFRHHSVFPSNSLECSYVLWYIHFMSFVWQMPLWNRDKVWLLASVNLTQTPSRFGRDTLNGGNAPTRLTCEQACSL